MPTSAARVPSRVTNQGPGVWDNMDRAHPDVLSRLHGSQFVPPNNILCEDVNIRTCSVSLLTFFIKLRCIAANLGACIQYLDIIFHRTFGAKSLRIFT